MATDRRVCGAKTRRGTRCQIAPMPNGRCKLHGGKTPIGPAHGAFKHGRYSKYLPERLLSRYQEAANDPAILELTGDIALLDMRLGELVGKIGTGDSRELWKQLRTAMQAFIAALTKRDTNRMREPLKTLEELIGRGVAEELLWAEITDLFDQRRKLVESERKRLVEMQQMITNEQAMVLLAVVVDTIRKHVTDRQALAAISADIKRLVADKSRG